mmetsp:Transcript_36020/g.43021  ORF Transcript_36020/g.43021 Transcript_36020/m.43021 type:complete len:597 (+) Transcript_36020:206-1996(+)
MMISRDRTNPPPTLTLTYILLTIGLLASSSSDCHPATHAFQIVPATTKQQRLPQRYYSSSSPSPSPSSSLGWNHGTRLTKNRSLPTTTTVVRQSTMRNDNISFFERPNDNKKKTTTTNTNNNTQRQTQQRMENGDGGGGRQQQQRRRRTRAAFDPDEVEVVPRKSFEQEDSSYAQECVVTDPRSKACFPFVGMLRDSANYIANHRHTTAVYHIPGELLEWDGFPALMDDIALTWLLGMRVVIVAGCRHQINARLHANTQHPTNDEPSSSSSSHHSSSNNNNSIMPNSLRVTSLQTMRIVEEEAGYVRFEIERQLNRCLRLHGGADLRVPGALNSNVVSGNFVIAEPIGVLLDAEEADEDGSGVDFQYTGVPSTVQVKKIRSLHDRGDLVLLTSCTTSPSGEHLNVRSESLAAHVAASMKASKIVYCSNECMVLRNGETGKTVQNFRSQDARDVLAKYDIWMDSNFLPWIGGGSGGNVDKEQAGLSRSALEYLLQIGWANLALERGVGRAHIVAPSDGALLTELFTAKDGSGTCISQDEVEEIHPDENFYGDDTDGGGDEFDGSMAGGVGGRRSKTLPIAPPPRRVRGSEWRTAPFS